MVPITEKQLERLLELRENVARINELDRAQSFIDGKHYYARRKQLAQLVESLKSKLTGSEEILVGRKVTQYISTYTKF